MRCSKEVYRMIETKMDRARRHVFSVVIGAICVFIMYTFLLILGSSFSSQKAINQYGFSVIPKEFSLDGYSRVFLNVGSVLQSYWITFLTTILGTIIGLLVTALMGYVLSRDDYPYRRIVSFYCYFTMLFSGGLVPTYMLVANWLHLKNTIWALILPSCVSVWNMMLIRSYFKSLPYSLIEAAKIDGMSEFGIFFKIVVPLSKPAFATIGLFYALSYWNQWYSSLLYTDDKKFVTLQYLLMKIMKSIEFLNSEALASSGLTLMGLDAPTHNVRMAMCIVVAGPILLVFPFFQKYFVKGLNVGAVKG